MGATLMRQASGVERFVCGTASTVAASSFRPIDNRAALANPAMSAREREKELCMKAFAPESKLFTFGGVFYPTGHVFLMFPTAEAALDAERKLIDAGCDGGQICLLTPQDIHEKVAAGAMHTDD